jgi:hypothetical protein
LLTAIDCIRHGPFCKLPNIRKRSLFACRLRQLNAGKYPTIGQVGTRSELHRPDTKAPDIAEIHLAFRFGQRIPSVDDLSEVIRSLDKTAQGGGDGLIHKGRGQSSNHSLCDGVRGYVLDLVKTKYADFGPTLATEVLLAKHDIQVGRETLRTWMLEEGLWLSRKQRRTFHQPRLQRESYGELLQIDGSDHRWFEQRGEPCTLLVFIDDATSKLMQLRFVPSESTDSYFAALEGYVNDHGCPVAFYSDKHTVFRVNKPDAKGARV